MYPEHSAKTIRLEHDQYSAVRPCRPSKFCPKCDQLLSAGYVRDIAVEVCVKCRGVWVEASKEKQVLNIQPAVFSLDELKQFKKRYQPTQRSERRGYVPCPQCAALMN